MSSNVILDTAVIESLWAGDAGSDWLERVASGEPKPVISAATLADLAWPHTGTGRRRYS